MKTERINKGNSIISFPTNFTVIDIETTGFSPEFDNIIELAAIKVCDGAITDTFTSLVYPGCNIDEYIEELTGITNDMLKGAPYLIAALPKFLDFIGDDILLGHNVNFDINFIYDKSEKVLKKSLTNNFIDTMRIFRKLYPELNHHRLKDLSQIYDISYIGAHRALADCEITFSAYQKLLHEINLKFSTQEDFINSFKRKSKSHTSFKADDISATTDDIDPHNPFYDKIFVFTGTLERMSRKEAMQIVVNHGGINSDGITKKTNFLVLGNNDYCKSIKDGKSSKQKKAEKLKLSGQDIEIIPESVFYDMIE